MNTRMPKIMLNYIPSGRRRFGSLLKRLLDETEAGLAKPNSRQMIMMIMVMNKQLKGYRRSGNEVRKMQHLLETTEELNENRTNRWRKE